MKMNWFTRLIVAILVVVLIYFIYLLNPVWIWAVHLIWVGSIPFVIAGFISYLMHPFINILEKKNMKRWLAITIVFICFFGLGGVLAYFVAVNFYEQVQEFVKQAPELTQSYHSYLMKVDKQMTDMPSGVQEGANAAVDSVELIILEKVEGFVKRIEELPSVILTITLVPFITFYLIKDTSVIKHFFIGLIPRKWEASFRAYFVEVNSSLGGFVRGQVFVCTILGVLASISFSLVNMNYSVLLGTIIGITNIIPNFGPILGAIPAVLIAFTISKSMVVKVIAIMIGLQIIEGNLVSPLVMGKTIHLHPLLVMMALFIGGEVAGFAGLILSVPILAVVKVTYSHIKFHYKNYVEDKLNEEN